MPKYKSVPSPWWGWVISVAIIAGFIYICWDNPWFLPSLVVFAVCLHVIAKSPAEDLRNTAAKRPNDSICTFARSFDCRKVDTWVIRATYEQIRELMSLEIDDFPLRIEDHLVDDLHIEHDDFELDLMEKISQRTGRPLSTFEMMRIPYAQNLKTVGDLVHMFNLLPKQAA